MNGLALITDMEYIKVGNKGFTPQGVKLLLTRGLSPCAVSDAGRKIARIDYDLRNNPVRIQFTNGNVTKYVYSAAGEKLRVIYQTAVPNISVAIGSTRELAFYEIQYRDSTDYLLGGSLTLKNGRIDKYLFDEGYCQAGENTVNVTQDYFTINYYDRDHLGNIRQVTRADRTKTGTVIQSMDYYPFGAKFCHSGTDNNVQPYRYNGKEFDKMHGLNTYDYGARQYNPITARWDRIDPLAEKYYNVSPYNYCMNNPVILVDPNGMDWILSTGDKVYWYGGDVGDNSQLLYTYNATSGNIVERNDGGFNDYQEAKYQNLKDKGPTPEGSYYINLKVDPEREAKMNSNKQFLKSPEGGTESLVFTNPDTGMRSYYPAWGKKRASLTPVKVTGAKNSERDNNSYYFHDSEKGYYK